MADLKMCALLLLLLGWSGFVIQTWEVTYDSNMPTPGLGTRNVGALTGPESLDWGWAITIHSSSKFSLSSGGPLSLGMHGIKENILDLYPTTSYRSTLVDFLGTAASISDSGMMAYYRQGGKSQAKVEGRDQDKAQEEEGIKLP